MEESFSAGPKRRWRLCRAGTGVLRGAATYRRRYKTPSTPSQPIDGSAAQARGRTDVHEAKHNDSHFYSSSEAPARRLHSKVAERINSKFGARQRPPKSVVSGNLTARSSETSKSKESKSSGSSGEYEYYKTALQLAAAHLPSLYGQAPKEQTKPTLPTVRKRLGIGASLSLHEVSDINREHGRMMFGPDMDNPDPQYVPKLMKETGYSRRQLYELFMQFKALCAMSPSTEGIDRETFRRGIPVLMAEDHGFVERVYDLLDEDGSGTIEWDEFITAMAKLDKGTRRYRASFLFDVYDLDGGQTLDTDELLEMLLFSLHIKPEDASKQLLDFLTEMTEKILADVDVNHGGELARHKILDFVEQHPEIEDVSKIFGRGMIPTSGFLEMQQLLRHSEGRKRIRTFTKAVQDSDQEIEASRSLLNSQRPSFRFGDHIARVASMRLKQARFAADTTDDEKSSKEESRPSTSREGASSGTGGAQDPPEGPLAARGLGERKPSKKALLQAAGLMSLGDIDGKTPQVRIYSRPSVDPEPSKTLGRRKLSKQQILARNDPRRASTDILMEGFIRQSSKTSIKDVLPAEFERRDSKRNLSDMKPPPTRPGGRAPGTAPSSYADVLKSAEGAADGGMEGIEDLIDTVLEHDEGVSDSDSSDEEDLPEATLGDL